MSNSMYDTGGPKKIIVEHHIVHEESRVSRPAGTYCPDCGRWIAELPCNWCEARHRRHQGVTLPAEFEVIKDPKRLK